MSERKHPKAGAPSFWEFARMVASTTSDKAKALEQFNRDWNASHPAATAEDKAKALADLEAIFAP